MNPGVEPRSPALQMDSLPSEPEGKPTQLNGKVLNSALTKAGKVLVSPLHAPVFLGFQGKPSPWRRDRLHSSILGLPLWLS